MINGSENLSLRDLLAVEDDPAVLDFRCRHTGLPLWPQIRVVFFRMIMSDLLYGAPLTGTSPVRVPWHRAISTLGRSALRNEITRLNGSCRAEICITVDGLSDELIDGKWFNRLVDHFALEYSDRTVVIHDQFEWKWRFPRQHPRVMLHCPRQVGNAIRGHLGVRDKHRRYAAKLITFLIERASRFLNWTPGEQRERQLIDMLARKIASMPSQYATYQTMLERIAPRLLMVGMGCYGPAASLIAAAKSVGIVTAEYQHGANAGGHDAYNFAPALCASEDYLNTIPQYFLSYGDWWNQQINAPMEKVAIGNPHREWRMRETSGGNSRKEDILILSDGTDFALYLALAREVESALNRKRWRVVLRPHPLERTAVQSLYGQQIGGISIDGGADLYRALHSAHAVVSEVSTGLFEAVGIAERLFIWDTPKARFAYPSHPFQSFSSAGMLVELLERDDTGRLNDLESQAIWAHPWRERYANFLRNVGVAVS